MISIQPKPSRVITHRHDFRALASALLALGLLGSLTALPARAQSADQTAATTDGPDEEFAPGHGSVGLEFQHAYSHGDYDGPGGVGKAAGDVSFYTYELEASYFFAPGWEVEASLPYSTAKFAGGPGAHPQLPCPVTASYCAPVLVDDGSYHGTFADWHAEVRYHADLSGYYLIPALGIYVPSHNYAFYGSGTVGARVTKYQAGLELDHQFDFTNFFYTARALYTVLPRTLGIDANYARFGFELGYFINPRLALRGITDLKIGHGYTDDQIGENYGFDGTNPAFALHDKFRLEDNGNVGVAVDYRFGAESNYLLTVSLLHSVWGRSNLDLTYDLGVRLTRNF